MVQRHSFTAGRDTSSIREQLVPFRFWLPVSARHTDLVRATSDDEMSPEARLWNQLPSSLRVISSDTAGFKSRSPTASVSAMYQLQAHVLLGSKVIASSEKKIRVQGCLDPSPPLHLDRFTTNFAYRQEVALRKSVFKKGGILLLEASEPDPLTFQKAQSTATTKFQLDLTYRNGGLGGKPPTIDATIRWRLKSFTSIDMRTAISSRYAQETSAAPWSTEIRSALPYRQIKMTWSDWIRGDRSVGSHEEDSNTTWHATHVLWLSEPISSMLTPSFQTAFLSHRYNLLLHIDLSGTGRAQAELTLPVQVVYQSPTSETPCPDYGTDSGLPVYEE